jgi:hypothetical protein
MGHEQQQSEALSSDRRQIGHMEDNSVGELFP